MKQGAEVQVAVKATRKEGAKDAINLGVVDAPAGLTTFGPPYETHFSCDRPRACTQAATQR